MEKKKNHREILLELLRKKLPMILFSSAFLSVFLGAHFIRNGRGLLLAYTGVVLALTGLCLYNNRQDLWPTKKKDGTSSLERRYEGYELPAWTKVLSWILLAISVFLLITKPVYNRIYYFASFANALVTLLKMLQGFRYQQKLAMRRPPQFDRKGADDRA